MNQPTESVDSRKHAVIVGGGFAGLSCAKKLASDSGLPITLIDKNNYQQFQPLLYQVATGILSPGNAAFNLRDVLVHHENVEVKMSEIVSVDLAKRQVTGKTGDVYQGDFLVFAAGNCGEFLWDSWRRPICLPDVFARRCGTDSIPYSRTLRGRRYKERNCE